ARDIGMKKATTVAAYGGLILSLFMAMTGLYAIYMKVFNPNFFLLSGFLAYSALKEKRTASYIAVRDITLKRDIISKEGALVTRELVVLYDIPLKDIIKKFVPHRY